MEQFKKDYVTREAGEKLRLQVIQALETDTKIEIDFSDAIVASTSFFDEGIAKLGLTNIPFKKIRDLLILKHLHPRDLDLLKNICQKRGFDFLVLS